MTESDHWCCSSDAAVLYISCEGVVEERREWFQVFVLQPCWTLLSCEGSSVVPLFSLLFFFFFFCLDSQQKGSFSVQLQHENSNYCSLAYSSEFLKPQLDVQHCFHFSWVQKALSVVQADGLSSITLSCPCWSANCSFIYRLVLFSYGQPKPNKRI